MPSRNVRRASLRHRERRAQRVRRAAALLVIAAIVVVTLTLTAFGSPAPRRAVSELTPPKAAIAVGPPRQQVIALQGTLRLQLPVAQERVSAVAYHAASSGALPLTPIGKRANNGFLRRLVERVLGTGRSGRTWYQLEGADGPPTSALDVGAPTGTNVYAPVDGTVVALAAYVVNGKRFGVRMDIQPARAPSLVVSVTRIGAAKTLAVGDAVVAGRSRIGRVLDLSTVERQALSRYTQDAGNHVTLEVRPAASRALS